MRARKRSTDVDETPIGYALPVLRMFSVRVTQLARMAFDYYANPT